MSVINNGGALIIYERGEIMLQTPINVEPSNGQVRNTNDHISINFTFQGDLLTFVQGEVVDMEYRGNPSSGTNQYVAWYNMPMNGHLSAIHNGQSVGYADYNGWMANWMVRGHNYKHRMRLFQHYPNGLNKAGEPMPDMYYARGKIYQNTENIQLAKNQTLIAPYLDNIKPPYYYQWTVDGVTHKILLGAIYMDIQYEQHMISDYNWNTGVVTFQKVNFKNTTLSDGSQMYTVREVDTIIDDNLSYDSLFQPENKQSYKMFTNYLETGWYDFKWRTAPVITTEIKPSAGDDDSAEDKRGVECGIACDGTYTQAENVGLKWYKYQLYAVDAYDYNNRQAYIRGNLVIHNNLIYKCISNISKNPNNFYNDDGVAFVDEHWNAISLDNNSTTLIDETDKIYSYDLNTNFPTHPFTFGYASKLTITTQDNDEVSQYYSIGRYNDNARYTIITNIVGDENPHILGWYEYNSDSNSYYLTPDTAVQSGKTYFYNQNANISNIKINNKYYLFNGNPTSITVDESIIHITWNATDKYIYDVFRREVYSDGSLEPFAIYIGNVIPNTNSTFFEIYDYSVANNATYQYEIVVKDNSNSAALYGRPFYTEYIRNINTKWDGWRIQAIFPQKDSNNRKYMKVGDEWAFISAIDSGDIVRNINSVLHVGTSSYAKTTRNHNKYESGSFTANLLSILCPDNDIIDNMEKVKTWMEFICGDNPFVLKSDKGDVWIVNIVNSPSRQYDETIEPIFTKIRYDWAESYDKNKCVFVK